MLFLFVKINTKQELHHHTGQFIATVTIYARHFHSSLGGDFARFSRGIDLRKSSMQNSHFLLFDAATSLLSLSRKGKTIFPLCVFNFFRPKVPKKQEKAPKSNDFGAFLWWARRDLNSKVFVLSPVKVRYFIPFRMLRLTFLCYYIPHFTH